MVEIRITGIERLEAAAGSVKGWGLDFPEEIASYPGYYLPIAGWAAGRERPVKRVAFLHEDIPLTSMLVDAVRPDVDAHLGLVDGSEPTGFVGALSVVSLPERFELNVRAVFEGAPGAEIAVLRGTRSPVRSAFRPAMQPLSLTSLGRTGTTLVMEMLARHQEILVQDVHPFETRLGAYWMHALTILSAPANHVRSSHPDRFLQEPFFIGNNPYASDNPPYGEAYRSWMREESVEEVAAFCQERIERAYQRIAADQGRGPARFFAEKNVPTHVPRILSHLYDGMREVVLVRDFRDMICSMKAFDAKRKNVNFQRDDATAQDFARRIILDFGRLVAAWRERRESAFLLRYEDLVAEPRVWLRRLTDYAGIDSSDAAIDRMIAAATVETAESRAHKTTASWAGSTGRYLRDMSPEMRRFCAEEGGEVLEVLGYQP
jgi:hypothetical protein